MSAVERGSRGQPCCWRAHLQLGRNALCPVGQPQPGRDLGGSVGGEVVSGAEGCAVLLAHARGRVGQHCLETAVRAEQQQPGGVLIQPAERADGAVGKLGRNVVCAAVATHRHI